MSDAATIVRDYLVNMRQIYDTGQAVPETSYYGVMASLFNAIGSLLGDSVFCVLNPKNRGAGIPDGGLFIDLNLGEVRLDRPGFPRSPERGVIEAKSTSADIDQIVSSEQVEKYLNAYGQVLVTNFYQFVLVTRSAAGSQRVSEPYNLTETEREFWNGDIQNILKNRAEGLMLFLQHVMLLPAPISEPQALASTLAYYAKFTKARIERDDVDLSVLDDVKQQLEQALGVKFEAETGDEFFRSTLVQTLFYGIFSAWVLWWESNPAPGEKFELWRHIRDLNVPAIQELFEKVTAPSRLRPLNIEQVLERTADTLNRVEPSFFDAFEEGEAVQYFYEPFLEEFDPDLRKQLGVWYTPPQVVKYMVAKVDAALRDELGIEDGLLSDQVYVLDPCCGTGAYLVEVLRYIHQNAIYREGEAMAGQTVNEAVVESGRNSPRIFGFELLPAPFVISHLQIGLLLRKMGAPIHDGSRAGVYLTNSLTGWDDSPKTKVMFPELAKERDAAQNVKQKEPILVILGNPPYYSKAESPPLKIGEERALIEAYRQTANPDAPDPAGQGLNDLYVRFYRMAERKITENTGRGIICFISNYSWLDGLSHPGMRERYLEVFDSITIDSLNGDKYRTGKVIPKGQPNAGRADPSIFSTPFNSDGIQVGTAIATLVRREDDKHSTQELRFRDLWGRDKLNQLDNEAQSQIAPSYDIYAPEIRLGYPFMPRETSEEYLTWPKLEDLFPVSFSGVKTSRDAMLIDIDKATLIRRIQAYLDTSVSHVEMTSLESGVMTNSGRYDAKSIREYMQKRDYCGVIVRYYYRPLDLRWLYWDSETKLLDEKRLEYFPHVRSDNVWIEARKRPPTDFFDRGLFTRQLGDQLGNGMSSYFPLYLYEAEDDNKPTTKNMFDLEGGDNKRRANISKAAQIYLNNLGSDAEILFYHALAIMHSTVYRTEHIGALRQDWPRIPLPADSHVLEQSFLLGKKISQLLDPDADVAGVTSGEIRPELRDVTVLKTDDGVNPNFKVTNWGRTSDGKVFGKSGKTITNDDGQVDIYLNGSTYWSNVPQDVWSYRLGGYPVLKKWLSYRDYDVLGREIYPDEARTFMNIARRIAAILALETELDENYAAVKADIYEFPS